MPGTDRDAGNSDQEMSTPDIAAERGVDLRASQEYFRKLQQALPPEVSGPPDQSGAVARLDAGLEGPGLRDQFMIEARKDPAIAMRLLSSPHGQLLLSEALEQMSSDTKSLVRVETAALTAIANMTDEEFNEAAFRSSQPLSERERLMQQAAGASFTNLNRVRFAGEQGMSLEDVPVEDGEPVESLVEESLEEREVETRPQPMEDPLAKEREYSQDGQRSFVGLDSYRMLPPEAKGMAASFLGPEFVAAAEFKDRIPAAVDRVMDAYLARTRVGGMTPDEAAPKAVDLVAREMGLSEHERDELGTRFAQALVDVAIRAYSS